MVEGEGERGRICMNQDQVVCEPMGEHLRSKK